MPGGSSVRSLLPSSLKATRNRNNQPSLSVGRTELTALLYFICFQESFKRRRRVLELCSWPMREAVAPLHCWSEPGLNHGLLPSARVYARKDSGKKQEHDQTIPPKYIHMCTRLRNKANDRVAESSHIGKAREAHLSPKLVPIPHSTHRLEADLQKGKRSWCIEKSRRQCSKRAVDIPADRF